MVSTLRSEAPPVEPEATDAGSGDTAGSTRPRAGSAGSPRVGVRPDVGARERRSERASNEPERPKAWADPSRGAEVTANRPAARTLLRPLCRSPRIRRREGRADAGERADRSVEFC